MIKLLAIIPGQVPEFVQSNYPAFLEFVKAYYRWMDEQSATYSTIVDIDDTPAQFLEYFKKQVDVFNLLSNNEFFDNRYIKYIKDLYSSKGSEQFLIRILEIAYNSKSTIEYPSKYILRASDGKWIRDAYIVLELQYGTIPTGIYDYFYINNDNKEKVRLKKYETLDNGKLKLYFDSSVRVNINPNDIIDIKDSEGTIIYAGKVVSVPDKIDIVNGGSRWIVGQIFTIPGTYENSICKVIKVDENGKILYASIYEHGYDHNDAEVDITSFNLYNNDQTLVKLHFNGLSKLEGYWKDDSGKISHDSIRLPDSLYYQIFSYVIDSNIPTEKYIGLAERVNPAGTKMFTSYNLEYGITLVVTAATRTPHKYLFFGPEFIDIYDGVRLHLTRPLTSNNTRLSDLIAKIMTKIVPTLEGQFNVSDNRIMTFNKVLTDQHNVSDVALRLFTKAITDDTNVSDNLIKSFTSALNDTINIQDVTAFTDTKVLTETARIGHGPVVFSMGVPYSSESYFSEGYNAAEFILTI